MSEVARRDEDEPRLRHLVGLNSRLKKDEIPSVDRVKAVERGRRERPDGTTEEYQRIEYRKR